MNDKIVNFLKKCTDDEIFSIVSNLDTEISHRIVDLLKANGCTSVEFSLDDIYFTVNNIYGTHKFDEGLDTKVVNVREVGFTNVYCNGEVFKEYIYLITNDGEYFCGDDLEPNEFWDLYHSIKEKFSKFNK